MGTKEKIQSAINESMALDNIPAICVSCDIEEACFLFNEFLPAGAEWARTEFDEDAWDVCAWDDSCEEQQTIVRIYISCPQS